MVYRKRTRKGVNEFMKTRDTVVCYSAVIKDVHFGTGKILHIKSFWDKRKAEKWLLEHEQSTDLLREYKLSCLYAFMGWVVLKHYVC